MTEARRTNANVTRRAGLRPNPRCRRRATHGPRSASRYHADDHTQANPYRLATERSIGRAGSERRGLRLRTLARETCQTTCQTNPDGRTRMMPDGSTATPPLTWTNTDGVGRGDTGHERTQWAHNPKA